MLEALSADSIQEARWARKAESDERARRFETSRARSRRAPGLDSHPLALRDSLEALLAESGVRLLNNRRVPGARATVDHLAIGPQGVTVIGAVREGGRARVVDDRLLVDGEDRTGLVVEVRRQMEVIRLGLAASPGLPVSGAICWVGPGGLPRVRRLALDGVPIDGPRALAEELRRPGPVSSRWVRHFASVLDRRLPPRD